MFQWKGVIPKGCFSFQIWKYEEINHFLKKLKNICIMNGNSMNFVSIAIKDPVTVKIVLLVWTINPSSSFQPLPNLFSEIKIESMI